MENQYISMGKALVHSAPFSAQDTNRPNTMKTTMVSSPSKKIYKPNKYPYHKIQILVLGNREILDPTPCQLATGARGSPRRRKRPLKTG